MVPDSVANRNSAEADVVPSVTANPVPPLKTAPVGAPSTLTTSDWGDPSPLYSVEVSVPLFATHQNVDGPAVSPHAFTRFSSTVSASPGRSATRLVTTYPAVWPVAAEPRPIEVATPSASTPPTVLRTLPLIPPSFARR
jgi:hypothetical protein